MNEINALTKETPEGSRPLLPGEVTEKDELRTGDWALTKMNLPEPSSWTFQPPEP